MILRFGELFCGAGGMSLGVSQAHLVAPDGKVWKYQPRWALDSNRDATETYRLGIHGGDPEADVHCTDVRTVDAASLSDVEVLFFGFPCNDFSAIGARRGLHGEYGPLYLEAVRVLRAKRPLAFIAENVPGLRSAHGGKALAQVVHDLTMSGYRVTAHLYKLEEYGVPQRRHRIFLIGIRQDLKRDFRHPAPTTLIPITAGEALSQPFTGPVWNHEARGARIPTIERIRHIPPGASLWDVQEQPSFPAHLRVNVPSGQQFRMLYRRFHPDLPAWTIVAGGGGGSRPFHWNEPRLLTNRECARFQGFPDSFRFLGGIDSVRRQIGMAVPPPAARAIGEALLKTLAGVDYPAVDANIPLPQVKLPRGRPPRLEAKTDGARAQDYRRRRVTENRVAAEVLLSLLHSKAELPLTGVELGLVARFVKRTLGMEVRHQSCQRIMNTSMYAPLADRPDGMTRSQRHRLRVRDELRAAQWLLSHVVEHGALGKACEQDKLATIAKFIRREIGH